MGRSGYSDDCSGWELVMWRGAVDRALCGARGQAFLRKLRDALDAMPSKRLIADEPQDASGDVCALGTIDPGFGKVVDYEEPEQVGRHFGIARAMAAEIVYENDEAHRYRYDRETNTSRDETPEERWVRMRNWVDAQIVKSE